MIFCILVCNFFTSKHYRSRCRSRCNLSSTRNRVSSGYPNTESRVENTTRSRVFLTKFEVLGKPMKPVSGVFDISSQSKQKLKSKQRSKIVKIYANLLHAYDFLCLSLRGENLDRGQYPSCPFQPIHIRKFGSSQSL